MHPGPQAASSPLTVSDTCGLLCILGDPGDYHAVYGAAGWEAGVYPGLPDPARRNAGAAYLPVYRPGLCAGSGEDAQMDVAVVRDALCDNIDYMYESAPSSAVQSVFHD